MANATATLTRRLILGDYRVLEAAFLSEVRDLKSEDALKPIIVVIPSRLLGIHLSRYLAQNGLPHANLRFLTLEDLASSVASPALIGSGKTAVRQLLQRQLLVEIAGRFTQRDSEFYFAAISERTGFHEAMLSTIMDLKKACLTPEDLRRLLAAERVKKAVNMKKLGNVLDIWDAYETGMRELGWHDGCDTLETACREVAASRLVTGSSAILIYGFYDLGTLQKRFVCACLQANNMTTFVPFSPERAFDYVRPFIGWLKSQGFREQVPEKPAQDAYREPIRSLCQNLFTPGSPVKNIANNLRIISAPGEVREVREIIRMVSHEGADADLPLHETAILLRHSRPYTSLFRDSFRSVGLAPYILEGPELRETRPGRSLCLMLDVLRHDFARSAVMEFAAFARLDLKRFCAGGESIRPVTLWDLITIDAGIVAGEDEWKTHLAELLRQREGADAATVPYSIEDIRAVTRFSDCLIKALTSIRRSAKWPDMVSTLISAYTSLVEPEDETPHVIRAVADLAKLDDLGIEPSAGSLLGLVDEVLTDTLDPEGRFQRSGPTVASLIAARGIPFRTIIIPGMVEKSFPSPPRQNAILLDGERKALNLEVSGKEAEPVELRAEKHLDLERLFFLLAVGAARERLVLTFPRLAIGTSKERVPSSFVLATIEAATGRRVDFETAETFPAFDRIPLSRIGADEPRRALDEGEFDLAIASRDLVTNIPDGISYLSKTSDSFVRALDLESAKWGKSPFTPYDGVLTSKMSREHLAAKYSLLSRSVAPTRLETYATCPYKYYLEEVLRIKALVEPEHVETIDPRERGGLIHTILWEFFTALKQKHKGRVPVVVEQPDLGLLHATARRNLDRYEKLGLTGYPMMWKIEQRGIVTRLEELFAEELEQTDYFPAYFEVRYGMASRGEVESEASVDEAVPVLFGKRKISLRGKIDRIDLSRDCRRARVVDYKTGKSRPSYKDNDLAEGKSLQLPFYLYAAGEIMKRLHEGLRVDYAEYYHMALAGSKRHIRFDYDELEEQKKNLAFIVGTIADGIETGLFFAYPPGDACHYCDFSLICGTARDYIYERKSRDRRIGAFLKMKGEAGDQEEDDF
jgi:RecB family exonuclease